MADLYNMWSQARDRGEQRGADYVIRQNIQPALSGNADALSTIFSKSPDTGMKVQGFVADQRKASAEQLGKVSAAFAQSKNPVLYKQWRDLAIANGAPADMPETLTSPEDLQGALSAAQAFGQAYGSMQQPEQFTLSPGSARYDAAGRLLVQQPFQEKPDFQLYDSGSGPVWIPKPVGGGAPSPAAAPVAGSPMNPPQDFQQLVSSFGAQPTSLFRDPEHNRRVGGVANSQHTAGTAGDFAIPPQNRPAFIAQARQMGYEAIDEGDHVHVELPPGAQASGRFGPGQGVQGIPVTGVTPKRSGATFAPLSQDEIAQLGLPAGTVAQRNLETGQVSVINKPDARAGTGETPLSAGEAAKVRRDFKDTRDALGMFQALDKSLKEVPGGIGTALDPEARGRLGTSYNNARSALRILYNTGVLQPGELPMLEEALRNPASYMALLDPRTRPQLRGQLDELYRTVDRGIQNQVASYPQIFNPQKYEASRTKRAGSPSRTVTRTGTLNGRKVVQYSDGTTEYAD